MRTTIIALTIATLCTAAIPAYAQKKDAVSCDEASMMKMNDNIKAMPAGEGKQMAMEEMDMASQTMKEKDMTACINHMQSAKKAMGK